MRPPLDPLAPLLTAAARPHAVLVLGDKMVRCWYETRPAVIDADPESETPGAALWVGSRHLVVRAIRAGCFRPTRVGRRLTEYQLTPEGRSLGRDLAGTASAMHARIGALERELQEVYGTIDAAIECDQGVIQRGLTATQIARGQISGDMSMQTVVLLCLRERLGNWVTSDAIAYAVGSSRADGNPKKERIAGSVTMLRRRGWLIEGDRRRGYRLQSADRGEPEAAQALAWRPAERPQPAQSERRVCRMCRQDLWLGMFSWRPSVGCYETACRDCRNADARERKRRRRVVQP